MRSRGRLSLVGLVLFMALLLSSAVPVSAHGWNYQLVVNAPYGYDFYSVKVFGVNQHESYTQYIWYRDSYQATSKVIQNWWWSSGHTTAVYSKLTRNGQINREVSCHFSLSEWSSTNWVTVHLNENSGCVVQRGYWPRGLVVY